MATDETQGPTVEDDAVGTSSAPPPEGAADAGSTDDSTDTDASTSLNVVPSDSSSESTDSTSSSSEEDTDPHPDGITTSDVEATAGQPPTLEGNTTGVAADPDAEVSPTGTANEAGTPQSQLNQAPPMSDPSGSNIPAPNLRQPLAEGADPSAGASSTTADSLDRALVDPEGVAKERVEGRTSDASLRSADGPQIDEVPPDLGDGPKPSDGGPERYPFPQGGDVDVATVPETDAEGEYLPNLTIEDTVTLKEHELVPERLVGRRALIVDAPRYLIPKDQAADVWITVRTRDEVNATLTLPLAAVDINRGSVDVAVRG